MESIEINIQDSQPGSIYSMIFDKYGHKVRVFKRKNQCKIFIYKGHEFHEPGTNGKSNEQIFNVLVNQFDKIDELIKLTRYEHE